MTTEAPCILMVDDDPVFQRFVELVLTPAGYHIVAAEDGVVGREWLERLGTDAFDCVLADYRMPRLDGLSLLDWLRHRDASLAAVLVTAEGEKKHVEQSLRAGACNFLNKPVTSGELRLTVADAVEVTAQRRRSLELKADVERVGQSRKAIVSFYEAHAELGVDLFFRPKTEVGGDFFHYLRVSETQELILVSDVSGHDFRAAQGSAFFHGALHGMIECQAPLERVLMRHNDYLLGLFNHSPDALSIAVSALLLDHAAGTLTALSCGAPHPLWIEPDGSPRHAEGLYSPPLGWFDDFELASTTVPCPASPIWLWTDGVEDLASQLGATPFSVTHALLQAKASGVDPAWLHDANDDILVARINSPSPGRPAALPEMLPLVAARYAAGEEKDIDALQAVWDASIRIAVPQVSADCLYSLLLASREAVLNALLHGCRAGGWATFEINYYPARQVLETHISDPGCGHSFDTEEHLRADRPQLADAHRGLMLIRRLAANVATQRNGADLRLEFAVG